ncbi:MAG TPA: HAD family hydrolase [Longimicrobium sp.]|jgi:phosphoglycolate phosphatase/putative hydrolase of the HAD superfamily
MTRLPADLRALVFDVDGTLYDQRAMRLAMLRRLAVACVRNPRSGARTLRVIRAYRRAQEEMRLAPAGTGLLADAQIDLACARSGLSRQVVGDTVAEWMDQAPLAILRRFILPGLAELLAAAGKRGIACAVVSDYPAADKLRALGIDQHFRVVVSAQDPHVGAFKPSPAGLLHALRELGTAPEHAVYVGDRRDVDLVTARRAGTGFILVGRSPAPPGDPFPVVRDYTALQALLGW